MLRVIRIIGIVVFALLVGFSGNSLREMHENGELMERYNSGRKANITLLSVSVVGVVALSWFELVGARRRGKRPGYGVRHYREEKAETPSDQDVTSIYSAPKSVDEWKSRRSSRGRPRGSSRGKRAFN